MRTGVKIIMALGTEYLTVTNRQQFSSKLLELLNAGTFKWINVECHKKIKT